MEVMETTPREKLSKEFVINEAEKYDNTNGSIAFAKGVRFAVNLLLPYITDYWKTKVRNLIK